MQASAFRIRSGNHGTFWLASFVLTLCGPHSGVEAHRIVGVPVGYTPGTAPFVQIDPTSGAYTILGTEGNSYHSLAQDSSGDLYAGYFSTTASNGRIARIDPLTGAPLQIFNAVTPGAGDIRGVSFDNSDRLFAVVNRNDMFGSPTINDDLYEIDLTNQTTQLIGSLGFLRVQSLDVARNGTFYAWDVQAGLLTVDPITGLAADVNDGIGGTAQIQSIVFAPDGRLFGARNQLFSINPTTGAFIPIGVGGNIDLRGIEWIIPEPASAILLLLGTVGLCRCVPLARQCSF